MSDLLSIGASGLAAYRNALNTIGENVANAETPRYSRRTDRPWKRISTGDHRIS